MEPGPVESVLAVASSYWLAFAVLLLGGFGSEHLVCCPSFETALRASSG